MRTAATIVALAVGLAAGCARDEPGPAQDQRAASVQYPAAATRERRQESLETLIGFSDPANCKPVPAFAALLDGLLVRDTSGRFVPGRAPASPLIGAPRFQSHREAGDDWIKAVLPVAGEWHGLSLLQVSRFTVQEGDSMSVSLTFRDAKPAVVAALNNLGFRLPPGGRKEVGEELPQVFEVLSRGDATEFLCGT